MRQNTVNTGSRTNRLLSQLTAGKKKTVLAFCLIALMAFMWVRVLTKKGPEAAEATMMAQQRDSEEQVKPQLNISFIELPKVAGRNDVITRDFFSSDGWQAFVKDEEGKNWTGNAEVSLISGDRNREVLSNVARKLKLEAIELGENPRAFINGKLLSAGDKLQLKDGGHASECEVVRIEENMVVVRCAEVEITLKLMEATELDD